MLVSMRGLRGKRVCSRDGRAGVIHDVCYDDRDWRVRYLTLDLGRVAPGERVQMEPEALEKVERKPGQAKTKLRWNELKSLPPVAADPPVSVQNEIRPPSALPVGDLGPDTCLSADPDPHLRSLRTLGYFVESKNGDVGRIRDFLVSPKDWRVPFFVVDSDALAPGKEVVLSTDLIDEVRWSDTTARVPIKCERFLQVQE